MSNPNPSSSSSLNLSNDSVFFTNSRNEHDDKSQKKMNNYLKKKAWRENFKLQNRERVQSGLDKIKRPYNRGKAWRIRGSNRKVQGLPVGPTTF